MKGKGLHKYGSIQKSFSDRGLAEPSMEKLLKMGRIKGRISWLTVMPSTLN